MEIFGKTVSSAALSLLILSSVVSAVALTVFFTRTVDFGGIEIIANCYEIDVYTDETLAVPVSVISWTPDLVIGGQTVMSDLLMISLTPEAQTVVGETYVWIRYEVLDLPAGWDLTVMKREVGQTSWAEWVPITGKQILSGDNPMREIQFTLVTAVGSEPGIYSGFSIVFESSDE